MRAARTARSRPASAISISTSKFTCASCDSDLRSRTTTATVVAARTRRRKGSFLYHRFHETPRVVAEFTHDLVVIGLLDGDGLQGVLRQPQQTRIGIGH